MEKSSKNQDFKVWDMPGIKLLLIVSGLIFIFYGFLVYYNYISDVSNANLSKKLADAEKTVGDLVNYNETLTASAKLYAITSSNEWEQKYNIYADKLEQTLRNALEIAFDENQKDILNKMNEVSKKLSETENLAFTFVAQGNAPSADSLLSSSEYNRNKALFAADVRSLLDRLRTDVEKNQRSNTFNKIFANAIGALLVFVMIFLAVSSIRRTAKFLREIFEAQNKKLAESEKEMKAIAEKQLEANEQLFLAQKEAKEKNVQLEKAQQETRNLLEQQEAANRKLILAQRELQKTLAEQNRTNQKLIEVQKELAKKAETLEKSEQRMRLIAEDLAHSEKEMRALAEAQLEANEKLMLAQKQIQAQAEKMKQAFRIAKAGAWSLEANLDGTEAILTLTDEYYELLGTNAQEQGGYKMPFQTWIERFALPEGIDKIMENFTQVLQNEEASVSIDIQVKKATGEVIFYESVIQTKHYKSEGKIRGEGIAQDITERKRAEEELQKALLTASSFKECIDTNLGYMEIGLDRTILNVNKQLASILGYEPDELIGKPHRTLAGTLYSDEEYNAFWQTIFEKEKFKGEMLRLTKNKTQTYLYGSYLLMRNYQTGMPEKVVKIAYDISTQKQQQEQIEIQNQQLKIREEELQRAFEKVKKSEEEMRFLAEAQLEANEKLLLAERDLQKKIEEETRKNEEIFARSQRENALNQILSASLSVEMGELDNFLEKTVDIISEIRFLKLLPGVGIFVKIGEDTYEMRKQKNISPKIQELCHNIKTGNCLCGLAALQKKTQYAHCVDERHTTRFEGIKEHGHYNIPIMDGDDVLGVIVVYLPHGHKRDEEEVQFLEAIANIVSATMTRLRVEEALAKRAEDLAHSEKEMRALAEAQLEANEKLMQAEKELKETLELEKQQKAELDKLLAQLKETQGQLVHNEKMASLGQLTAGIAHEINNPINFVYNGIDTLKISLDDLMEIVNKYNELDQSNGNKDAIIEEAKQLKKQLDFEELTQDIEHLVADIKKGAIRTMEIVKGLRVFSRLDEEERKTASIKECLESTLILLNNKIKGRITLKTYYDETMPDILCYPGQLNQVFMNIINNAIQAIPEDRKDGEVCIYTETQEENVIIRIKDNGIGMSEQVKRRIFEPFFTTKAVGVGTGLGLSITFGIIEKHGGQIFVNSEEGKGTEFVIQLPKER